MITIDRSLSTKKSELLHYFRSRATELLEENKRVFGSQDYKKLSRVTNQAISNARTTLIDSLRQKSTRENWTNEEILKCILLITYTNYVVMIECRNDIWLYDYMTFSRRIGELWEPFCKLCFEYPINDISLFVPPLFSEIKQKLSCEIITYIDNLNLTDKQKAELKIYYQKVWALVASGEIKLELDLHFECKNQKIVVDFKSGFGSNEKGNTNRLLMVATIYQNINENYKCMMLVRSEEEINNNYFQTLKKSEIWEAYCGNEAYGIIHEYSGFNIKDWIKNNIDWFSDLKPETINYFSNNKLSSYLTW
jgi:hypothetical protein